MVTFFDFSYVIGTLKLVESGVLMMPATMIGSNIGRKCCRCWFDVLADEANSGMNVVRIKLFKITQLTKPFS